MNNIYQCVQNANISSSPIQTINAIKESGFKGVFIQWYNEDWDFSQQEQINLCRELGLDIIFAHLGYKKINTIWQEDEIGDQLVDNYLKDLDNIKKNDINLVIMHLSSKSVAPPPSEIGIKRLQKICDYANNLSIKIAFENNKIKGYLEYVLDRINNDNVGICFDSGHCHCHFEDDFNWEKFKNKIFAVHLHDNDKSFDQHKLAFDGTIDWENTLKNLKEANYQGPIVLENHYNKDYFNFSLNDFYKESFKRGKKLEEIFNSI